VGTLMAILRRPDEDDPDEAAAQAAVRHYQQHRMVDPPRVDPECPLCADPLPDEWQLAWREL
jgi:hypothetical protein